MRRRFREELDEEEGDEMERQVLDLRPAHSRKKHDLKTIVRSTGKKDGRDE